jgi:transposase
MSTEVSELPRDPDLLIDKIVDLTSMIARMAEEKTALAAENDKLRLLLAEFKRAMFGTRSERLDPDQLALGLEDLEQSIAASEAAETKSEQPSRPPRAKAARNRGALPRHLPRFVVVIDVEDKSCPHGHGEMHVIGEDVTEMLDVIPAQYQVKRIIRPRYGCRTCESRRGPGASTGKANYWWHGDGGVAVLGRGGQIRLAPPAVSASADLPRSGYRSRSLDAGFLDWPNGVVAQTPVSAAALHDPILSEGVLRRNADASAGSGAGANQDRAVLGLRG